MKAFASFFLLLVLVGTFGGVSAQQTASFDLKAVWNSLTPEEQAGYLASGRSPETIKLPDQPAGSIGDTCSIPIVATGTLPFNDTNTTVGATDDYTYGAACGGFNASTGVGPDIAYVVRTSETCDLTVTMDPTANDLALWVLTDCNDAVGGCVGGDDSGGNGTAESVGPFTATAGTDYFVVVDGFAGASDSFSLNIVETTSTGCTLGNLTFNVGGTVSGLVGSGLVLQNNGGDDLLIAANGPFQFATEIADGEGYDVEVLTQPSGQFCDVGNGTGVVASADVTDIAVACGDIEIAVSATSIDFPDVAFGDSALAVLTVSNPGTVGLELLSFSITTGPFSITGGDCEPLPNTLAPGDSCAVEVTFAPSVEGNFSGTLTIESNAPDSPTVVDLSGSTAVALPVPTTGWLAMWVLIFAMMAVAGVMFRLRS